MRALLTIVLSTILFASSASAGGRDGGPRIRSLDQRTTAMIAAGMARSASFRALVEQINASDTFVYIGVSPLLRSSMAGRLSWMTKAGGFRYLRAAISPDQSAHHFIASLAHELQHVVEVIEDSNVVDEPSLESLYKRIGRRSQAHISTSWETSAAQDAGARVRRELSDKPATVVSRLFDSDKL